ncbi:hypothetical protein [Actinophytocola sp. KF-1]
MARRIVKLRWRQQLGLVQITTGSATSRDSGDPRYVGPRQRTRDPPRRHHPACGRVEEDRPVAEARKDRSSCPHHIPNKTAELVARRIVKLRWRQQLGLVQITTGSAPRQW